MVTRVFLGADSNVGCVPPSACVLCIPRSDPMCDCYLEFCARESVCSSVATYRYGVGGGGQGCLQPEHGSLTKPKGT